MAILRTPPCKPTQKHSVRIVIVPPPNNTTGLRNHAAWIATIDLEGITLAHMQSGLFWTTQNMRSSRGYYVPWREVLEPFDKTIHQMPWKQDFIRQWLVREFPDKPFSESRWTGTVSLFGHSASTLSGFCLGRLRREVIRVVVVEDEVGRVVFEFDAGDSRKNVNCLPLRGDAFDLWWVWPMESVIAKSSERGPGSVGSGGDKGDLVDCDIGGAASWKDVMVLVARSESVQTVARGIAWLLCAVGLTLCILALSLVALVVGVVAPTEHC